MNIFGIRFKMIPTVVGAGLLLVLLAACKPSAPPAKPAAAAPVSKNEATVMATNLPNPFVSVFDSSAPPENKGRDPFFPNSIRRLPASLPKPSIAMTTHVDPVLKLGSITGAKGRRFAVINNRYVLAQGQEADVAVATGKVHVVVVEIGEDYAVVTVAGEPGQKRLELFPNTRSP